MFLRRYPIARLMLIVYMVGSIEGKEREKWSGEERGVINRGRKERGRGLNREGSRRGRVDIG